MIREKYKTSDFSIGDLITVKFLDRSVCLLFVNWAGNLEMNTNVFSFDPTGRFLSTNNVIFRGKFWEPFDFESIKVSKIKNEQ